MLIIFQRMHWLVIPTVLSTCKDLCRHLPPKSGKPVATGQGGEWLLSETVGLD